QTARPPSAQNFLALLVDSIGLILRVQVKPGKRRVNNPITRSPNSQAKIGISKRAPQTFIKPAGFFEDIAAREEAGGGNGTAIARHQELAIGAIALRRKATKRRLRHGFTDADYHSSFLHGAGGADQLRANRADLRPLHMLR